MDRQQQRARVDSGEHFAVYAARPACETQSRALQVRIVFVCAQALIPDRITPRIMSFCDRKNTTIIGMTIRNDIAIIGGIWTL